MIDGAMSPEQQNHIAAVVRECPQSQDVPQLEADLAVLLRGTTDHLAPLEHLRRFVQALLVMADAPRAMNNLLHYVSLLPEPPALWDVWQRRPQALPCTLMLFAASSFLSNMVCRRPQWLFWLLDEALWAPPPSPEALTEQLTHLLYGKEEETEVTDSLRAFTHQHLLRIGARDLNGLADMETTTADLSALADCVVQAGLDACQRWLGAIYGAPTYTDDAGAQQPSHFCVIGMGKLGGYELNFSSDIDLMYVYTSYEGQTTGILRDGTWQNPISNHEYFITLARRLINVIGGKGPDGQAFRVDMRLRPNGTQGQLALSLLSYEAYYTRLGQTWEKMALLKARPIAGDRQLGETFLALIHPFVYQRHLDPEGIQRIRDIKSQIDTQIADKAQTHTNVKLGLGGIREIEFFIQILQLLFAGRQAQLQARNSLRALTQLREVGLVPDEVATALQQTYCYLRRVEHFLQMEQGSQTHTLPRGEAQRLRLARLCEFPSWEAFYQDYLERTETVHAIFTRAFEDPSLTDFLLSFPDEDIL